MRGLKRIWLSAGAKARGKRSTSGAGTAVDVLAAVPLISATTLSRAIGMSIKCAVELLDRLVAGEIVVGVTHRSARRLFGLSGMAPVREATAPPRRPVPGRGPGRPALAGEVAVTEAPPSLPPAARFERPSIDYAALEASMGHCEQAIRSAKRTLDGLAQRDGTRSDEDPATARNPRSSLCPPHAL